MIAPIPRGKLTREWWATCGRCGDQKAVGNGASDAKHVGWVLTRREGWVCPLCAGKGPL